MVGIANGSLFASNSQASADEIADAAPDSPVTGRRVAAPCYPIEIEGDDHSSVDGLRVDCARCGNRTEVHGTGKASYDAACCILRETCPKGESNFYAEP